MKIRELIEELKKFDEQDFVEVRTKKGKKRQIKDVKKLQDGSFISIVIDLYGNR